MNDNDEIIDSDIIDVDSESNKKKIFDSKFFSDVFIFFIVMFLLLFGLCPTFRSPRFTAFQKNCFYNIRAYSDAVEMYNMDNEDSPIKTLDNDSINILLKQGYFKNIPNPPLSKCKYLSQGDLASDSGIIYCEYHGESTGQIKGKIESDDDRKEEIKLIREFEFRQSIIKLEYYSLIALLSFIAAFLFVLISKTLFPKLITSTKIILLIIYLFFLAIGIKEFLSRLFFIFK